MALARILLAFTLPIACAQSPFGSVAPAPTGELRFTGQLPDFQATDIQGRIWRSDDLRGKFTLIYMWSTQEARMVDRVPSQSRGIAALLNLPEVQRFYDKVKNAKNLQVLTFCGDYESGDFMHAQDYMKQHGYTFPVITDYVTLGHLKLAIEDLFPRDWPQGPWLVNSQGQLSYRVRGWSFGRLLFEAERAAAN